MELFHRSRSAPGAKVLRLSDDQLRRYTDQEQALKIHREPN